MAFPRLRAPKRTAIPRVDVVFCPSPGEKELEFRLLRNSRRMSRLWVAGSERVKAAQPCGLLKVRMKVTANSPDNRAAAPTPGVPGPPLD